MPTLRDAAVIDYESLPKRDGTGHAPPPVGLAVRMPGAKAKYLACGHPIGNTHTFEDLRRELAAVVASGRPIICHSSKFEAAVSSEHLGVTLPLARVHDTLPMLFLKDARAKDFQLKNSGERVLGRKPEERDAVVDWLVEHQPVVGTTISRAKNSDNYAGKFIAYAPAPLVRDYAIQDTQLTYDLAQPLMKELETRQMVEAYEREQRTLPVTLEMERQGIRVDVERLHDDVKKYHGVLDKLDEWLRRKLKRDSLNVDSGEELVKALVAAGLATEADIGLTDGVKPKLRHDKDAFARAVKDPQLLAVLHYRSKLCTALRTFMEPWLNQARSSGGRIFTSWNSTRQDRGAGLVGARTGRFSSTPNFQNLPKQFEALFKQHEPDRKKRAALPDAPFTMLPLPRCRGYIVPWDKDHVLIDRDYSQQELRILGHYEGAVLMQAYLDDPWLDIHEHAQKMINAMLNTNFARKPIKNTGFGIVYGMGLGLLAEKSSCSVEMAKKIRDAYLAIFPGLKAMYQDMKDRARDGRPIRTWGGREYFCEEPKIVDGRIRQFDYKLLNVLIQGSAADCTKEALIRYYERKGPDARLYLTAHDELLVSVPRRDAKHHMQTLREAMESVKFDVPMLSEGTIGLTWEAPKEGDDPKPHQLFDYDKRGVPKANPFVH